MNKYFSLCLFASIFIFTSCSKTNDDTGTNTNTLHGILPLAVTTAPITSITQVSAISGGNVTADGGKSVTQRGICWNTAAMPTTANNMIVNGSGTGVFSASMSGLAPATTYYVRSFAINSSDTAYGADVSFATQPVSIAGGGVTDIDGNTYPTVILGGKEWMTQNLRVTKYRNGDLVPNVPVYATWHNLTTGAWCYYNNTPGYNNSYGKLYNSFAVIDPRQISPAGWHVPSSGEYAVLNAYFNGNAGTLKSAGFADWASPNTGATNSSGFTALPGGFLNTGFYNFGAYGYWWTSDPGQDYIRLDYNSAAMEITSTYNGQDGMSVRCIKD